MAILPAVPARKADAGLSYMGKTCHRAVVRRSGAARMREIETASENKADSGRIRPFCQNCGRVFQELPDVVGLG
ncbi:hypothetical protein [Sandarakinorhabdus sp.]|uniref:hypothetical protein n=1 Tax=Sandarakinorhabdus sp. TaxID=1916663 RepID=UPI003F6EC0B9